MRCAALAGFPLSFADYSLSALLFTPRPGADLGEVFCWPRHVAPVIRFALPVAILCVRFALVAWLFLVRLRRELVQRFALLAVLLARFAWRDGLWPSCARSVRRSWGLAFPAARHPLASRPTLRLVL